MYNESGKSPNNKLLELGGSGYCSKEMAALNDEPTIDHILLESFQKLQVDNKCDKTKPNKSDKPPKNIEKPSPELKPKKGLTPYQGDLRTFGYFHCEECISDWSSAYSWADTAQKCEVCKKFRFPHKQRPFYGMFTGGRRNGKPHIEPSCGKCIQIKDSCTKLKRCDERPESMQAPIVGLADAPQNIKAKRSPPKRKRNRQSKKD